MSHCDYFQKSDVKFMSSYHKSRKIGDFCHLVNIYVQFEQHRIFGMLQMTQAVEARPNLNIVLPQLNKHVLSPSFQLINIPQCFDCHRTEKNPFDSSIFCRMIGIRIMLSSINEIFQMRQKFISSKYMLMNMKP